MSIVTYSIPFFFLLIGLELLAAVFLKKKVYRLNDSIADLGCGIMQQSFGLFLKVFSIFLYGVAVQYLSVQVLLGAPAWATDLATWQGWAVALFAFILYDFLYYWAHRMSHETRLGWAGHVVHHSSEEYNLTVALRQSSFHLFFTSFFYVPMAIIGIPWEVFVAVAAINLVGQFWIHTRLIGKLWAPIEYVFNTPSHHRVHHGVNKKYIDKNHGAVLIIWDRLFGTFQAEEEEPVYGITVPLKSWNPFWANWHGIRDIFYYLARVRSVGDAFRVLFKGPGWRPDYLGGEIPLATPDRATYRKFEVPLTTALRAYAFTHFVVILGLAVYVLLFIPGPTIAPPVDWAQLAFPTELVGFSAFIILSLTILGGVLGRKRWGFALEAFRLTAVFVSAGVVGVQNEAWLLPAAAVAGAALLSLGVLLGQRRAFTSAGVEAELPDVAVVGLGA